MLFKINCTNWPDGWLVSWTYGRMDGWISMPGVRYGWLVGLRQF